MTLSEKCEHLMHVVVESRKRFGKMCIDYDQKTSLMENKLLNLQLETITNYRFKSKNILPDINVEEIVKNDDKFKEEILDAQKRLDKLQSHIKDTHNVVLQLKTDNVSKKLLKPLTAEAMLAAAKSKSHS